MNTSPTLQSLTGSQTHGRPAGTYSPPENHPCGGRLGYMALSNVEEYSYLKARTFIDAILLDHVTRGWETQTLDDSPLPADFMLDYVRVWQRKDLATPDDGPKPNAGTASE